MALGDRVHHRARHQRLSHQPPLRLDRPASPRLPAKDLDLRHPLTQGLVLQPLVRPVAKAILASSTSRARRPSPEGDPALALGRRAPYCCRRLISAPSFLAPAVTSGRLLTSGRLRAMDLWSDYIASTARLLSLPGRTAIDKIDQRGWSSRRASPGLRCNESDRARLSVALTSQLLAACP